MTTRTKLNAALFTSSVMMLVNVFSEPLGITGNVKWALLIGVFVPLGLVFYYSKKLKAEGANGSVTVGLAASRLSIERKKTGKRLIVIWACVVAYSLAAPIWLPITGVSLGTRGDFLVGVLTAALVSAIFAVRIKKTERPTGSGR